MDAVSTPGRGPGGPKVLLGELKVHNEDRRCRRKSLPVTGTVVTVTAGYGAIGNGGTVTWGHCVRTPAHRASGSLRAATAGDRDIMSLSRVKFTVRPGHWQ